MLTVNDSKIWGARPIARFKPKRLDTLRPEFRPLIGEVVTWRYAGTSDEDEPYPGQQRWQTDDERFEGYWTPAEDLEPVS